MKISTSSGLSFRCQQVAALSHTLRTAETSRDQYLDWELSQQVLEPEVGTWILQVIYPSSIESVTDGTYSVQYDVYSEQKLLLHCFIHPFLSLNNFRWKKPTHPTSSLFLHVTMVIHLQPVSADVLDGFCQSAAAVEQHLHPVSGSD